MGKRRPYGGDLSVSFWSAFSDSDDGPVKTKTGVSLFTPSFPLPQSIKGRILPSNECQIMPFFAPKWLRITRQAENFGNPGITMHVFRELVPESDPDGENEAVQGRSECIFLERFFHIGDTSRGPSISLSRRESLSSICASPEMTTEFNKRALQRVLSVILSDLFLKINIRPKGINEKKSD
jgi:hypothetical protein